MDAGLGHALLPSPAAPPGAVAAPDARACQATPVEDVQAVGLHGALPRQDQPQAALAAGEDGVTREQAKEAGDWFFNRLNTSVFTHTTIYQLHKVEYRGISAWTVTDDDRVIGFQMKIHLEFDKYLGFIDQDPGDLVIKVRYCGTSDEDGKPYYKVERTDFYVNGQKNFAHLGLECTITDIWTRRPFTPGSAHRLQPPSPRLASSARLFRLRQKDPKCWGMAVPSLHRLALAT